MTHKETTLHCFAQLLNNATAAAKMAQSAQGWEIPESAAAWQKEAKALAKKFETLDGQSFALASKNFAPHWGSSSKKPSPRKPLYKGHPLMAPAQSLGALAVAIESLDSAALDQAAREVAKHLAVPFERGGVAHLAFPHMGAGLKARKSQAGAQLSQWVSDWSEAAAAAIRPGLRAGEAIDERDEKFDALSALGAYWVDEQANEDRHGEMLGERGDDPATGVHAGGSLRSTTKAESPLAGPASGVHGAIKTVQDAAYVTERADPTPRRLGWLALALLLGDRPSPAQAASGHCAPAMRADASVALECPGARTKSTFTLNGKDRARRPAICAMQTAMELATLSYNAQHNYEGYALKRFGYAFGKDEERAKAQEDALMAAKTVATIAKAVDAVMKKAYALAEKIRDQWLKDQGFGQAHADAKAMEGKAKASVKAINWALAHPQAARAAKAEPGLAFASASSRYLGVEGGSPEELLAAAKVGWESKGLKAQAFAQASENAPIRNALMERASQEMASERRARAGKAAQVKLMCQALSAACVEGATPQEALSFAKWCEQDASKFFLGSQGVHPQLGAGIEPVEVGREREAKTALRGAEEKAKGQPWALRAAFRARVRGGGGWGSKPAQWGQGAWVLLDQAFGSAASRARLDWASMGPATRLADLARGARGAHAEALRQAEGDGPLGAFCARVAGGLGIDDAVDGNDLIGKTREALKAQWGLTNAAWKTLADIEPQQRERLAEALENRHREELERRGLALIAERKAREACQLELGLGFDLLSWPAQFGVPMKWVGAIAQLSESSKRAGELLSPSARSIKVDSEESARFALSEARAKAERLPRIVKSMADRLEAFEKAAIEAGAKNPVKAAIKKMNDQIDLVEDWLRASEDGVWQTLPPKATFGDLMRRQEHWHEDVAARAAAGDVGKRESKWDAPLGKHASEGWEATLLASASSLTEEGRAMSHCVSSYASQCKSGGSRIFSVKLNGDRACTLELGLRDAHGSSKNYQHAQAQAGDQWVMVQNKGRCNQEVKGAAAAFCKKIVKEMNAAHAKWAIQCEAKRSEAAKKAAQTRRKIVMGEAAIPAQPSAKPGRARPA